MTTPQAPDLDRMREAAERRLSWEENPDANDCFDGTISPTDVLYLLDRIAELEGERDAALREMGKYAREAGEAIGKLETSEAAGIVEGWKERALAAEARASTLQGEVDGLREALKRIDAWEPCHPEIRYVGRHPVQDIAKAALSQDQGGR